MSTSDHPATSCQLSTSGATLGAGGGTVQAAGGDATVGAGVGVFASGGVFHANRRSPSPSSLPITNPGKSSLAPPNASRMAPSLAGEPRMFTVMVIALNLQLRLVEVEYSSLNTRLQI